MRLEDSKIIKAVKNLFRLKKKLKWETNNTTIKNKINLFRLKKNQAIKDRIIRDARNFIEYEGED